MLEDWEIQARKKDRGGWAKTNWEKLPAERQLQRKEKAEAQIEKTKMARVRISKSIQTRPLKRN